MISLSCHDDLIFEKLVKRQASSTQVHISIDSVSYKQLYFLYISQIQHTIANLSQKKQNILKISEKWDLSGTLC